MPEEVKQEVDRLFSISPSDRARACWNLGKLGTRAVHAVPFLLALTADTNVAWFCTDGQGRWTTPGREAAYALGRIGPVALDSVLLLVPASRPSMRMNAAIALGEIGSPAAVPALLTLLKDSDWAVREQAAVALGKIKDSSAMEPLSAALKDPEWKVRMAAISAIAGIGGKAAVEPLLSVLDDRFPHIRAAATACLRDITGQDFGDTRDTWMKWWQEQKHTMQ